MMLSWQAWSRVYLTAHASLKECGPGTSPGRRNGKTPAERRQIVAGGPDVVRTDCNDSHARPVPAGDPRANGKEPRWALSSSPRSTWSEPQELRTTTSLA